MSRYNLFIYFDTDIRTHLGAELAALAASVLAHKPNRAIAENIEFVFHYSYQVLGADIDANPAAFALVFVDFNVCHLALPMPLFFFTPRTHLKKNN